MKLRDYILVALFAAIMAICSQITIYVPFLEVPFSMGLLGVFASAAILGFKRGVLAQLIYLLLGAIGMPVFAGFQGGIQAFFGKTGGYLIGYLVIAAIVGLYAGREKAISFLPLTAVMLLALIPFYALGAIQLAFVLDISTKTAVATGVLPFIVIDIAKVVCSSYFCVHAKTALKKAKVM